MFQIVYVNVWFEFKAFITVVNNSLVNPGRTFCVEPALSIQNK